MDALERYRDVIPDFSAFKDACERPLPNRVRVNRLAATPERVRASFSASGIDATPLAWNDAVLEVDTTDPGRTMPAYLGWVHSQDAASTLPVALMDVAPGDIVWDACAAPGSKTGQLAEALDDTGRLLATDDNLGRLSSLRFNTERLGVTCAIVDHADARHVTPAAYGLEAFDAALTDVPCTCEGICRKQPRVLDDLDPTHRDSLTTVQAEILDQAVANTTPGGEVIYSTCTFAPEENEAVVDTVLRNREVRIEPIELPIETAPGLTAWQAQSFHPDLERTRRVYPHLSDTGGFYCAKLRVGA